MPEQRFLERGDLRIRLLGVHRLGSGYASVRTVRRDCSLMPKPALGKVIGCALICLSLLVEYDRLQKTYLPTDLGSIENPVPPFFNT